jgi:hypothetical protein
VSGAVAVLVAITLYAALPEPLLLGPRFLITGLELAFAGGIDRDESVADEPADPAVPGGGAGARGVLGADQIDHQQTE